MFSKPIEAWLHDHGKDLHAICDDISQMHSDIFTQIRAAYRAAVTDKVIEHRILQEECEVNLKKLILRLRQMYQIVLLSDRLRDAVLSMEAQQY